MRELYASEAIGRKFQACQVESISTNNDTMRVTRGTETSSACHVSYSSDLRRQQPVFWLVKDRLQYVAHVLANPHL
jgi:hypothetical protein